MLYQQFLFFLKQEATKDIENDNTKNNVNEITSIQNSKCTNEKATNDIENEKVNIETVSIKGKNKYYNLLRTIFSSY